MLAPMLIGRAPDHREQIYDDLKRELRAYDHVGHGPLDIALWNLCGKLNNVSVKSMLGGYRDTLPTYASTYHGQESEGGLCTPEAFADFAEQCKSEGFHGFKIHGWNDGNVTREVENLLGVRKRVGDGWRLMIDPACQLRTWTDALTVGRACDEANYFWLWGPVSGRRRLSLRSPTTSRTVENAAPDQRARSRPRAEGLITWSTAAAT